MSELNALADVKQEGNDPFAFLEDTPADSPSEKDQPEEKPEVGDEGTDDPSNTPTDKDLPFGEHPRWIKREQELQELRAKQEEYEARLAELSAFQEEAMRQLADHEPVEIPEWFSEIHGDDPVAWQKYQAYEAERDQRLMSDLEAAQYEKQLQAQENAAHWEQWREDGVKSLEVKTGRKFDKNERNELFKVMLDYTPTDHTDQLDFEKGYRILQAIKGSGGTPNPQSQARKQIADTASRSSNNSGGGKKDYMTSNELRNKSWNQL